MKWYQCKKCTTLVKQASKPSYPGCPSKGSHDWYQLGDEGSDNFQCKKCSALVQTKSKPSYPGCPDGGSHDWRKL